MNVFYLAVVLVFPFAPVLGKNSDREMLRSVKDKKLMKLLPNPCTTLWSNVYQL
jgi:hypothetical protein